jgi:hypothetical protein
MFLGRAKKEMIFIWAAAPDLGGENIYGIWRIDDTDNSFLTQPFRIKYARQDIRLSIMISFTLPLGENEVIHTALSLSLSLSLCARMRECLCNASLPDTISCHFNSYSYN